MCSRPALGKAQTPSRRKPLIDGSQLPRTIDHPRNSPPIQGECRGSRAGLLRSSSWPAMEIRVSGPFTVETMPVGCASTVNLGVNLGINLGVNSGAHAGVNLGVNNGVNQNVNLGFNNGVNSGVNRSKDESKG